MSTSTVRLVRQTVSVKLRLPARDLEPYKFFSRLIIVVVQIAAIRIPTTAVILEQKTGLRDCDDFEVQSNTVCCTRWTSCLTRESR